MAERSPQNTATTTTNHPQPAAPSSSLHSLRTGHQPVQSSSPRTPCPVCQRTKDTDCRWGDDWIACHSAAAASGAPDTPGGTITVDGVTWALIRTGGGHSGAAHIYRPHRPGSGTRRGRSTALFHNEDDLRLVAKARLLHTHLRPQVHAALRLHSWEFCTIPEMRAVLTTHQQVVQLNTLLHQAKRIDPSIRSLIPCATHWRKQLGYAVADLNAFQSHHLGMAPTYLDGHGVVEVAS